MKIWTKLLTLVLVLGLAGAADAKAAKKKGDKGGVKGKITSVDGSSITIDSSTKKKAGESHTYKLAGAVITIDGATKTATDLQVGQLASVQAAGDKATSVTAVSAKGGKKKKKA